MSADRLAKEVRALVFLDLEALRSEWRGRWGSPPPLRSPELLRRMIAWRIQAAAEGDLSAEIKRALRRRTISSRPLRRLAPGTRLAREWRGSRHEVEVVEGGFAHEGVTYASLSKVAWVITGTKWNGPKFFGLGGEDR